MTESREDTPEDRYHELVAEYDAEYRRLKRNRAGLQTARRFLLAAAGGCLAASYLWSGHSAGWLIVAATLGAAAAAIQRFGFRCEQRVLHARDLVRINRFGIARRRRDWDQLPVTTVDQELASSPLAIDLDLFGEASLMQLLSTAQTDDGSAMLAEWLVQPAEAEEISRRQRAATRLAPELNWRQAFERRCMMVGFGRVQIGRLKRWSSDASTVHLGHWTMSYLIALRFLVPVIIAGFLIHPDVALSLLAIIVAINFAMTIAYSGAIHTHFGGIMVTPDAPSFHYLSDTFAQIVTSTPLQACDPQVVAVSEQAVIELRKLEKILALESISRNALFFFFVYLPLQFLVLWDLQMFRAAERWRARSGPNVSQWFRALGRVESLASLASLRFEQPSWEFAEIGGNEATSFIAEDLGHPLISDPDRVSNHVQVGPPGSLMLITGSNMGGKSTLLRAVGTNAILAQAGAPCCCRRLRLSNLRVMTSMRVSDSLSDATSFFVAQLLTLKRIVDQVKSQEHGGDGVPVMYLFDEILNGTNTTDRRVAVESLVGFLLQSTAIGAMTTHDLEIATQSRHRDRYRCFYLSHQFSDSGSETDLTFDYKLRPGVAPSSNALALARMLGIPEDTDSS